MYFISTGKARRSKGYKLMARHCIWSYPEAWHSWRWYMELWWDWLCNGSLYNLKDYHCSWAQWEASYSYSMELWMGYNHWVYWLWWLSYSTLGYPERKEHQAIWYQEIKSLHIQNEWKIKKRARRNATLGADTILSVQEGQNCFQQLDTQVDGHVEESTPRPWKWAAQRCSGCNIIGHTVWSCPSK